MAGAGLGRASSEGRGIRGSSCPKPCYLLRGAKYLEGARTKEIMHWPHGCVRQGKENWEMEANGARERGMRADGGVGFP